MLYELLALVRSLFVAQIFTFTGVLDDPRSDEDKEQDYLHEERASAYAAPIPDSFSNPKITESPYPIENQWRTSSCVPHGTTLALGIERKADGDEVYSRLSPLFTYRLRSNYGREGSSLPEMLSLGKKYGAPLFATLPTRTGMTEAQANALVLSGQAYTEAEIYRGLEYYSLEEPRDFEAIAAIAQQGHGVPILIYATYDEWAREYPVVLNPKLNPLYAQVRHCVCVLPKSGFWENGTRYVVIQDSAHFGGKSLRYVSEAFIKARCYGAGYWDTVQFIGSGKRPRYTFTKPLRVGSSGPEVQVMQQLLIAEGVLPVDCATGYFGGRTLAGVRAFQNKYAADILLPLRLDEPTSTWGSACIAKANQLCTRDK